MISSLYLQMKVLFSMPVEFPNCYPKLLVWVLQGWRMDKFTVDNRAIVRELIGRELWSIKEYRP